MAIDRAPFLRDRVTGLVGSVYVLIGAATGSLGPVTGQLRKELGLSRLVMGLHGAMFGWCLLIVALSAPWLSRFHSTRRLFALSPALMAAGVAVMALGHHLAITLAGALLIGAGGSLLVLIAPQVVSVHHGESNRTAAFVFVNGLSGVGTIGAPLMLAATLALGWGWRAPMFGLAIVAALGIGTLVVRIPVPARTISEARTSALALLRRDPELRRRWFVLVLGIGTEFGALLWGSTAVQELGHASVSIGAVAVGLFSAGMVLGRFVLPRHLLHRSRAAVLRWSFAATIAAFTALRFGPGSAGRVAGLFGIGLGLALVYPVAFSRFYEVRSYSDDEIGSVGALASGTAVTFAPLTLGALADGFGLGKALFVIPARNEVR